jgi:uncharacterized protein
MERLEKGIGTVAAHGHRRPGRALLLAAVLTAVGVYLAGQLSLNANLVALLPQSFQSVKDIKALEERFGGTGWVAVVGEGADPQTLRRFAAELAPRLEALPDIRFVEYRRPNDFFAERALYYLDDEDLEELHRRVRAREAWEKNLRNPLYVQLDDEPPPSVDLSELEQKYARDASRRIAGDAESYYLDPVQRRVVLMAKPEGNSADLGFSQRVVDQVEALVASIDTAAYGPDFKVGLTGTYKKKLDQTAQIGRDIAVASMVALAVLVLYLLIHFRSLVSVLLNLLPVGAGLAWTYGVVALSYGSVNLLTGFLGGILGGLGVEHGIHLLTRYFALRSEGAGSEQATRDAFTHTGGAALISALVAALTFFSLALSEFRAFREFGVIAGVGMLVMIAAYVLVLPATLGLAHRLGWRPPRAAAVSGASSPLSRLLPRLALPLAVGMGVLVVALAVNGRKVGFDFDFGALEDQQLPSFVLDKQVNKILGYSQTPVIVLTEQPEQERAVIDELARRSQALGDRSAIDFVGALDDLVPPNQERKQKVLGKIAAAVGRVSPEQVGADQKERFEQLRRAVHAVPFTRDELPQSIKRRFQGPSAEQSGFVMVYPAISLADGARVRDLAREVRGVALPDGRTMSAAGEPMVLADILEMVTREGPMILLAALLSVLAAMWLTLGNLRQALLCLTPTLVSIVALVGLMPLMQVQFNYLNLLVLPVLIGTTVDAGVHLLSRLSRTKPGEFSAVYAETGRAICGGLLTSAVGFGALLLADHPGLNSIGKLANLGFATNLLVMLIGFPALLLLFAGWTRRRDTPAEQVETAPVNEVAL